MSAVVSSVCSYKLQPPRKNGTSNVVFHLFFFIPFLVQVIQMLKQVQTRSTYQTFFSYQSWLSHQSFSFCLKRSTTKWQPVSRLLWRIFTAGVVVHSKNSDYKGGWSFVSLFILLLFSKCCISWQVFHHLVWLKWNSLLLVGVQVVSSTGVGTPTGKTFKRDPPPWTSPKTNTSLWVCCMLKLTLLRSTQRACSHRGAPLKSY